MILSVIKFDCKNGGFVKTLHSKSLNSLIYRTMNQ